MSPKLIQPLLLKPTPESNQPQPLTVEDANWFIQHYPWDTVENMSKKLKRSHSTLRRLASEYNLQKLPSPLTTKIIKKYESKTPFPAKRCINSNAEDTFIIYINKKPTSIEIPASIFEQLFNIY